MREKPLSRVRKSVTSAPGARLTSGSMRSRDLAYRPPFARHGSPAGLQKSPLLRVVSHARMRGLVANALCARSIVALMKRSYRELGNSPERATSIAASALGSGTLWGPAGRRNGGPTRPAIEPPSQLRKLVTSALRSRSMMALMKHRDRQLRDAPESAHKTPPLACGPDTLWRPKRHPSPPTHVRRALPHANAQGACGGAEVGVIPAPVRLHHGPREEGKADTPAVPERQTRRARQEAASRAARSRH